MKIYPNQEARAKKRLVKERKEDLAREANEWASRKSSEVYCCLSLIGLPLSWTSFLIPHATDSRVSHVLIETVCSSPTLEPSGCAACHTLFFFFFSLFLIIRT